MRIDYLSGRRILAAHWRGVSVCTLFKNAVPGYDLFRARASSLPISSPRVIRNSKWARAHYLLFFLLRFMRFYHFFCVVPFRSVACMCVCHHRCCWSCLPSGDDVVVCIWCVSLWNPNAFYHISTTTSFAGREKEDEEKMEGFSNRNVWAFGCWYLLLSSLHLFLYLSLAYSILLLLYLHVVSCCCAQPSPSVLSTISYSIKTPLNVSAPNSNFICAWHIRDSTPVKIRRRRNHVTKDKTSKPTTPTRTVLHTTLCRAQKSRRRLI